MEEKSMFPIRNVDEFYNFFKFHLEQSQKESKEPNLAFLSIAIGCLEYHLTLTKSSDLHSSSTESETDATTARNWMHSDEGKADVGDTEHDAVSQSSEHADQFLPLEFDMIGTLYLKFTIILKGLVDKSLPENTTRSGYATRELCKKVSDIMWNRLNPHYHKDKAHIQSLFSFLTGRQLDCFGLAFAVIAACQVLRYSDVHLALSEDHAWAAHGDNSKEMTEITWHGKGTEDKRGFSLKVTDTEKSWMYLQNNAVICDRMMEVAAMVVAINPAIDIHTDSKALCDLQHKMLLLLHGIGALDRYPMGLGVLAELEESSSIHTLAVKAVEEHYAGTHVFPYCTLGRFYCRYGESKKAIRCWSRAAQVLSLYNYTREDEAIYKEIMDIAGECIPSAIKNDPSVCKDRDSFMDLIRLYDGLCLWEEDSPTPVLHSWWAKYFTHSLGKFTSEVRECFKEEDLPASRTRGTDSAGEEHESKSKSATVSRKSMRHGNKLEDPGEACADEKTPQRQPPSRLGVKSAKMRGLEELLICGKKINAHTVSLQLTAQSQVHFVKRRSNISDYSMEYHGRSKRQKLD